MEIGNHQSISYRESFKHKYVQDGLIFMLDAYENAGIGLHDTKAKVWKDLAGEINPAVSDGCIWHDDNIEIPVNGIIESMDLVPDFLTLETVYKSASLVNHSGRIISLNAGRAGLCRRASPFIVTGDTTRAREYSSGSGIENQLQTRTFVYLTPSVSNVNDIIYVNGNKISGQIVTSGSMPSTGHFKIESLSVKRYFYCIRVYNRQLTDDEIAKNASVDKKRFGI